MSETLPPDYFDALYATSPDPWSFETRPYEHAKYDATLAALPRPRYRNAFEIGCSIGVLSERLAARCARLLSVDVSEQALARARERCRELPQVRFARMQFPREQPEELFDLVVMSEVGYYLSASELRAALAAIARLLPSGGQLLLVHWTPLVTDYPLAGETVHDIAHAFARGTGTLRPLVGRREALYRLDLFERERGGSLPRAQSREPAL